MFISGLTNYDRTPVPFLKLKPPSFYENFNFAFSSTPIDCHSNLFHAVSHVEIYQAFASLNIRKSCLTELEIEYQWVYEFVKITSFKYKSFQTVFYCMYMDRLIKSKLFSMHDISITQGEIQYQSFILICLCRRPSRTIQGLGIVEAMGKGFWKSR